MQSNRRSRGTLITSAGVPATLASTVAPTATSQAAHAVAGRQRWTLGVVCSATALLLFNVTAPIVALPSITADLRLSFSSQQWVLSSYALVLASLLLAGGALGDRFGRRRLFLAGLGVFGVGSAVAALAGSGAVLIVGRGVQGIGAAAIFPAALALVAAEFDGAARARAIGIWGATVSAAIALGPLGGGVHDFGGPWGLAWAARNPEAFASATLINTGVLPDYKWHRYARIWRTPVVGELFQLTATRGAFRMLVGRKNPRLQPDAIDHLYEAARGWPTKRAVLKLYRASPAKSLRGPIEELAALNRPALVLWGTADAYLPWQLAERQRMAFPSAHMELLEGLGHWPFHEDPARIAELVIPFLRAQVTAPVA
ncbi:MAG TPA: MFS transporter [Thermoleophilaceae bacterium]|jgi:MFS family permease|nr:MFS transporter [Thermoleophilaceae bacterium]